jgi:hypothetical protein
MKKLEKIRSLHVQTLLLAAILAQRHQPVASCIALDPLHWALHLVSYQCFTMASKTASKYGAFIVVFFAADPIIHREDTEQIFDQ